MKNTNENTIPEFTGKYSFLSNFYYSKITILGLVYLSVEAAFQASKTMDTNKRIRFANVSPSKAKNMGRKLELRADWNEMTRLECMELCLRAKFTIPDLRDQLVATGSARLVEGNDWGDTTWGVCNGVGKNLLGQLLMNIRDDLNNQPE